MSRPNALKFLILQTLNKNKSKININIHKEIANSLNIKIEKEFFVINWFLQGEKKEISIKESKFSFYVKSEFNQMYDREQIDKNEINANKITLEIISTSLN